MTKRLELLFTNQGGTNVTITVDEPNEPVSGQAVSQVMDTILASDVFESAYGKLVLKRGARIVERKVEEVEI